MENDQQKRKIAKRIIIATIALVAVLAVGVGVALLLKNVSNLAKDQSSPSPNTDTSVQTPAIPSAASIISEYTEPQTMRIFTSGYQLQQATSAPSRIMYMADGKKYEVSLATDHYALFYAKDGVAHADSPTVEAQTTSYLQGKGFQKTKATSPDLATYTNNGSVCQLTKAPESTPAYYLMACTDKVDVEKEYASIEELLSLYKKTSKLSTFTRALSVTVTAGSKTMTTLSLTTPGKHPVLLFAAVDGDWEYLGDLGNGDATVSNGKYSLTPQIQSAIHDAKYGDFLANNLQ